MMPSRKKTDLSRLTRQAKRSRIRRLNMTEEARASIRERDRLATIRRRNMESAERRAARLESGRLQARKRRSAALARFKLNERERVRITEKHTQRTRVNCR